jgi:hypothetical protein
MDAPIREKMLRFQMSVPAEEKVLNFILTLMIWVEKLYYHSYD